MTDEERAMLSADDAELLNKVRAGDTSAFQVLYERHEEAARRLARDLVATDADIDEAVAETFAQLLEVTRRGGGPADAFRPYLLTALRRVCDGRLATAKPDDAAIDPIVASAGQSLISRAFLSLPERWIAVLWHTDIEAASAAEVAPLLRLSGNDVSTLRRRARAGLRQAYLQMYTSGVDRPECATVASRLGAFIQDAVSGPDGAMVTEHLSQCEDCRAVFAELSDISIALRAKVAPVFLGGSAEYYLSGTPEGQASTALAPVVGTALVRTAVAGPTHRAARGGARWLRPARMFRNSARPLRWLAAGSAAVLAAGGIAFAVSLTGHGTPVAGRDRTQAAAPEETATVAAPSATAPRSGTSPATRPVSARRTTGTPAAPPTSPAQLTSPAQPPGTPTPSGSVSSSQPSVQLAATVDVQGGHNPHWDAKVVFQVSDTGSARTGGLIASVALPAGSWLISWPPGHGEGDGNDQAASYSSGGWSCQATSSGASCQHSPISAGGQSQGTIFIKFSGSSACGQPVSVTAASGSASASAQSPEGIQC